MCGEFGMQQTGEEQDAVEADLQVLPEQRLVVRGSVAQLVEPADGGVDGLPAGAGRERAVQERNSQRLLTGAGGR